MSLAGSWGRLFLKCSSRFSFSLTDDSKLPPPPTLEPTGPAPSLSEQESPPDPPTLKPISDNKPPSRFLKPRKVEENELLRKSPLQLGNEPFQDLLSDGGINRLTLMASDDPDDAPLSNVGRHTSVLFKKAKNGAKLQRSPDGALENGEDHDAAGSPASPGSIEDEQHSRKRLRSRSCSESDGERTSQQEEETGDLPVTALATFHLLLCFALPASTSPSRPAL